MRLTIALTLGLMALGGCSELSVEGDRLARDTAKGVVNGVVASRFPGVNVTPLTDCIIETASISEVYLIAEAAVLGPNPGTTQLIMDIAQRPATVNCATEKAFGAFLGGQ
jgi:hypothetical protein